jgi:hypothetical protein
MVRGEFAPAILLRSGCARIRAGDMKDIDLGWHPLVRLLLHGDLVSRHEQALHAIAYLVSEKSWTDHQPDHQQRVGAPRQMRPAEFRHRDLRHEVWARRSRASICHLDLPDAGANRSPPPPRERHLAGGRRRGAPDYTPWLDAKQDNCSNGLPRPGANG